MQGIIYINTIEARSKKSNLELAISESERNVISRNDVDIGSK